MASTDMVNTPDTAGVPKAPPVIGDLDIVFACPACSGELVVDHQGAGMQVPCPHCGENLTIPPYQLRPLSGPSVDDAPTEARALPVPSPLRTFNFAGQTPEQIDRRTGELQHQLKENRSQDTEMRGHVNRATMELHRLQLRLKKLQERQADIEAELVALQTFSTNGG